MSIARAAMTCAECRLDGGPFSADEAAVHVTTHNRLHHGGAPTAAAVAVTGGTESSLAA